MNDTERAMMTVTLRDAEKRWVQAQLHVRQLEYVTTVISAAVVKMMVDRGVEELAVSMEDVQRLQDQGKTLTTSYDADTGVCTFTIQTRREEADGIAGGIVHNGGSGDRCGGGDQSTGADESGSPDGPSV